VELVRPLSELINSGKTLTKQEVAAVEKNLWSRSYVLSLGRDYQLSGEEKKQKISWYKTWSKQDEDCKTNQDR
jgi:hypothetical protein